MASVATQDFLPMFAAGNDGGLSDVALGGDRLSGERTVTSPGTCKNCMTVGATDGVASSAAPGRYGGFVTYDMTVVADSGSGGTSDSGGELSFKVCAVGRRAFLAGACACLARISCCCKALAVRVSFP